VAIPTHPHTAMTDPPDAQPLLPPAHSGAGEHEPAPGPAAEPPPGETVAPSRLATINWAAVGNGLFPTLLSGALLAFMVFTFTSLDRRVGALETRVAALENGIAVIETRVAAVENRLAVFEHRVAARFDELEAKIDEEADRLEAKIDRLEARFEARFAAQDAKIDALDDKMDEISLTLTALVAALNKTGDVDAALAGEAAPDLDTS